MSFELTRNERVDDGLRRLARKELRAARRTLIGRPAPAADAIHEARKSLKKARAIVQLIQADGARGVGNSAKRLRKIARTLSGIRDVDATFEIVRKLRSKERGLFDDRTLKQLRIWLAGRRNRVMSAAREKDAWSWVNDELRALRRKARRWRTSHHSFRVLAEGIGRTHRQGRKAMTRALGRRRADDFHRWRKQIKRLLYELRLFEDASPQIARDVRALHQAETLLGDDHNIVVLCAALSDGGSGPRPPVNVARLRAAADRYHEQARKKAVDAARRVYKRKPRRYVRSLKNAWRRWRRHEAQQMG